MVHALMLAALLLIAATAKMSEAPQTSSDEPVVATYSRAGDP